MKRNHSDRWRKYLVNEMQQRGISAELAEALVQEWLDEIATERFDRQTKPACEISERLPLKTSEGAGGADSQLRCIWSIFAAYPLAKDPGSKP